MIDKNKQTGYHHPLYSDSLCEFGKPQLLELSGGSILIRSIPGFELFDAIGSYPLFCCNDWSKLYLDLKRLSNKLVTLSVVTDPFGSYNEKLLRHCFKGVVFPFKEHFVVNLESDKHLSISKHHRYYSRNSLKKIKVDICEDPQEFLPHWIGLYRELIKRHNIKGISAFSDTSFRKQLSIPGLIVFRAMYQSKLIGAHIWYVHGNIAYSHLVSVNSLGHELMASYALYWTAIEYFLGKVQWLNLGGSAGKKAGVRDGLRQFKSGWTNDTKMAYFCGHIFDQDHYNHLVEASGFLKTDYFPAYLNK